MSTGSHTSHAKKYLMVGGALFVLTALTVGVSLFHFTIGLAVFIGMAVAITKGSLVAAYFMHLIDEHKSIYWILFLTLFFFLVLLLLPVITDTGNMEKLLEGR